MPCLPRYSIYELRPIHAEELLWSGLSIVQLGKRVSRRIRMFHFVSDVSQLRASALTLGCRLVVNIRFPRVVI